MTEPDQTKRAAAELTPGGGPVVVLVGPQLGENIGMAARAMLNFGLTELRLVQPRAGWPNPKAVNAASGADVVIEGAQVFETTIDAVADLNRLAATTARLRDMTKKVETPREWGMSARQALAAGDRCGIMFGPERVGLHNDDLALADTLVNVPTNAAFSSINLAQSVLLLGYEWHMAGGVAPPHEILRKGWGSVPATQEQLIGFYEHLESELDKSGFLRVVEKRPRMVRNIRNIFNRIGLTDQEVRTLRGIIASLVDRRRG